MLEMWKGKKITHLLIRNSNWNKWLMWVYNRWIGQGLLQPVNICFSLNFVYKIQYFLWMSFNSMFDFSALVSIDCVTLMSKPQAACSRGQTILLWLAFHPSLEHSNSKPNYQHRNHWANLSMNRGFYIRNSGFSSEKPLQHELNHVSE